MSLALRIKNTETEDTGKYECKATNGFGHVTVDYILIVLREYVISGSFITQSVLVLSVLVSA